MYKVLQDKRPEQLNAKKVKEDLQTVELVI